MNTSRKYLYFELTCMVLAATVLTLLSYPCLEITGENSIGGIGTTKTCLDAPQQWCGTSKWGKDNNQSCPPGVKRYKCIGAHDDHLCEDWSWSICNAYIACEHGSNQACTG